jgi:hypothetical protein
MMLPIQGRGAIRSHGAELMVLPGLGKEMHYWLQVRFRSYSATPRLIEARLAAILIEVAYKRFSPFL